MSYRANLFALFTLSLPALAQDPGTSSEAGTESNEVEGLLPVPDYSGDWAERSKLTGDWGGRRQEWAERGVTVDLDWYQVYQDVVDGGLGTGDEWATNLDLRATLDLMRMDVVPGALVTIRAQSKFGDTVNDATGVLLPVNAYSFFPLSSEADGEVDIAFTELNWLQFLSERFGILLGKITTVKSSNEFMGGQGKTQFMNFQLMYSAVLAQLVPYSTLAAGAVWMPSSTWTVTTTFMNLTDASTTSGFDDIGDGTTWATTADYVASLNELPGGGSFGVFYGFDSEFAQVRGLNIDPGGGVGVDTQSKAWGLSWNGWQYLSVEGNPVAVDLVFEDSASGFEVYYDFALTGSVSLTIDAQWTQSSFPNVDDATILGLRLNAGF